MKNIFFFYSIFFKICFFSIIFLLFYSYFIPENLLDISVEKRFLKWSKEHWLGTDQLGRDFFSFLVIATRNSIFFATLALLLGSLLGTLLAIFSFYFIKTNYLWEQISQLLIAIPVVLIAIIIHTFYGSGWFSLLAISFFNVPFFYYLTKNISHKILAKEYALFSLAIGNSKWNIYRLHIFPQLYGAWLVQFSIQWSFALLMEAGLSYLGLGIQPPSPSLGRLLFETQTFYYLKSSLIFIPAGVIFFLVVTINYFADSLAKIFRIKNIYD